MVKFEIRNKNLYFQGERLNSFTCFIGDENIKFSLFSNLVKDRCFKRKVLEINNDGSISTIFKSNVRSKSEYKYYYCLSYDNFYINIYTNNKIENCDNFKNLKLSNNIRK